MADLEEKLKEQEKIDKKVSWVVNNQLSGIDYEL